MAGFYEGTDLADKVFYGFRLDPDTGNLNIEVLDGVTLEDKIKIWNKAKKSDVKEEND